LFEPKTTRARAAQAVDSADGSEELNPNVQHALQNAIQAEEGEQEDRKDYDGDGGTERSAINENGATGEDVITPVGKLKEANRSSKGSTRDDVSQRKSSGRRPRATKETITKAPRTSRPSSSSGKRETTNQADAKYGMTETRSTEVAPKTSVSNGPAVLPKQRRFSTRDATSDMVVQEHGPKNDTEDGDTMVFNQRSSGREKRKTRRYSADVEEMAEQHRKHPVGILTPSKRNRTGARKSVAFEDDVQQWEEQLNFKDIEQGSLATDNVELKSKASNSDPKLGRGSEPTDVSPERVPVAEEDESEEDELVVDDTAWPNTVPVLDSPVNTRPVLNSLPEVHADPHLTAIKAVVISRLTNSSLVPLTNLATEYVKVHSLLKATITAGEGNSILILGARGSGKTNLIETALVDVSHAHAEDFHVVRLNGFQQTDDKIALRDIWRQLGREMQVEEDETNQVSSYADTMASLLHLLSHPEELAEVLDPDAQATTTKSVIFLLDEFDLFATHPRQTLLYNLFDIAQAKKAPIAVIGCSTRVDVAESLEKRVKSRFSHRWVHLSQPKSFQAFAEVIEAALCLEVAEGDMIDDSESGWRAAWNEYIKVRHTVDWSDLFY
jgi:energy-coupling factor transporter ATP-binding protein EcfA2